MARFDVYATDAGLLLDVQTDLIRGLGTRLVVPLILEEDAPPVVRRLHPVFPIAERRYVMATHLMVAVSDRQLGRPIISLYDQYDRIIAALDMIFLGF